MGNKKVLIVDDDIDFLEEVSETLTRSGYDTVMVNNSHEVLGAVERSKPDVIMLDLKMPGINGVHLAYEIEKRFHEKEIPLIAVSGFFDQGYDLVMNYGFVKTCLRKPFRPVDAIAKIESVLKKDGA